MIRSMISFVTTVLIVMGLCSASSFAAGAPLSPNDYFLEQWLVGTIGGFITGPVMERVAVLAYCGPEEERPSEEKVICQGYGTLLFRIIFYTIGIPIGVSSGIILDGWVHKIDGNVGAAITMSIAGGASWMVWAFVLNIGTDYLVQQPGFEDLKPWAEPFKALVTVFWPTIMTSFMATLAYQSGAKFQDEKAPKRQDPRPPSDWFLPIVRFSFKF
ncbi:hypothetical protein HY009_03660 [Candidatus Acetothermia bacterium]|nr:hypothetical protein [Candidatus Acetothermia bacterium]